MYSTCNNGKGSIMILDKIETLLDKYEKTEIKLSRDLSKIVLSSTKNTAIEYRQQIKLRIAELSAIAIKNNWNENKFKFELEIMLKAEI